MKWFQHESGAHSSPRMIKLRAKYGAAGVGLYWYLVECIAETWETYGDTTHPELDMEVVEAELRIPSGHAPDMVQWMVLKGLFDPCEPGRVRCSSLGRYVGESQRKAARSKLNSGATPEPIRNNSGTTPEIQDKTVQERTGEEKREQDKTITPHPPKGASVRVPDVAGQDQSETDPDIQNARLHYLQGKPNLYRGTIAHAETREAIRAWRATPGAPAITDAEAERLACIVLPAESAANAGEIAERVAANEFCRAKMPFAVAMKPKNAGQILAGAFPADPKPESGLKSAAVLSFINGGKP